MRCGRSFVFGASSSGSGAAPGRSTTRSRGAHGRRAAEREDAARLERQRAVATGLAPPQVLELAQALGLGVGEVVALRRIVATS